VASLYLSPEAIEKNNLITTDSLVSSFIKFDGIEYTFDLSKPINSRVVNLKYMGKEIHPEQIFSLVVSSEILTQISNSLNSELIMHSSQPVYLVEAVKKYLSYHKILRDSYKESFFVKLNASDKEKKCFKPTEPKFLFLATSAKNNLWCL